MAKVMMRDISPDLSEEELEVLDALDSREIVYDEDSPKMTPEMLSQFHRFDQIPVRVSDSDMKKIRKISKEPRIILSKLLTMAINDPEMIKKCSV